VITVETELEGGVKLDLDEVGQKMERLLKQNLMGWCLDCVLLSFLSSILVLLYVVGGLFSSQVNSRLD
jgi:hypothetical protein